MLMSWFVLEGMAGRKCVQLSEYIAWRRATYRCQSRTVDGMDKIQAQEMGCSSYDDGSNLQANRGKLQKKRSYYNYSNLKSRSLEYNQKEDEEGIRIRFWSVGSVRNNFEWKKPCQGACRAASKARTTHD